jgi:hypothetical protein
MTTPVAGAEGQATEGTEGTETQQGPDFSPVLDRVEQLDARLEPVFEYVESQRQSSGPDPDADYQNFVDSLFGGQEGENGQAGADQFTQQQQVPQVPEFLQDPRLFQTLIDRAVERGVEQRVGPRLEAFENDRIERQVQDMLEELPGLQDPQAQQDTATAAQQIAHEMGQPDAWRNPAFFRMAYLARLAEQRSDAEVPADASGGEARLEGGGGGNPGTGDGPGLAQQIIGAHRGQASGGFKWS